jgi:CheY-like chemotaxis protein
MSSSLVLLVVEDEPLIRISTADLLQDAGFFVLEAEDAAEAIAILESRNDVQIVFSDIDLGSEMDGRGLLHHVASRWPPIMLFATSGRVFPGIVDELPPQATFFAKPYDPAAVISAFQSSLES